MQQNMQKEKTIFERQNKMTWRWWNETLFSQHIDPVSTTSFRIENSRVIPYEQNKLDVSLYQNKRWDMTKVAWLAMALPSEQVSDSKLTMRLVGLRELASLTGS